MTSKTLLMPSLGPIVPAVHRAFPDSRPLRFYEAAVPLYRLEVRVEIERQKDLSIFARFLMQAIQRGDSTLRRAAAALCIEVRDLGGAVAELQERRYIEAVPEPLVHWPNARIRLSEAGRQVVAGDLDPLIRESWSEDILYNTLSGELLRFPRGKHNWLKAGSHVDATGMYPLPKVLPPPRAENLSLDAIVRLLAGDDEIRRRGARVIGILESNVREIWYACGRDVFLLQGAQWLQREGTGAQGSKEQSPLHIAVFQTDLYRKDESDALQGWAGHTVLPVPNHAHIFTSQALKLDDVLSPEEAQLVSGIITAQVTIGRLTSLRSVVGEADAALESIQDPGVRLRDIPAILDQLQEEIKEHKSDLWLLTTGAVEVMCDTEQRKRMLAALANARSQVILIGPAMTRLGMDAEMCRCIVTCRRAGARVSIGCGKSYFKEEGRRHTIDLQSIREDCSAGLPSAYAYLPLTMFELETQNYSIFMCDDQIGLLTRYSLLADPGLRHDPFIERHGVWLAGGSRVVRLRACAEAILASGHVLQG